MATTAPCIWPVSRFLYHVVYFRQFILVAMCDPFAVQRRRPFEHAGVPPQARLVNVSPATPLRRQASD